MMGPEVKKEASRCRESNTGLSLILGVYAEGMPPKPQGVDGPAEQSALPDGLGGSDRNLMDLLIPKPDPELANRLAHGDGGEQGLGPIKLGADVIRTATGQGNQDVFLKVKPGLAGYSFVDGDRLARLIGTKKPQHIKLLEAKIDKLEALLGADFFGLGPHNNRD